jgi:hypothetical protein
MQLNPNPQVLTYPAAAPRQFGVCPHEVLRDDSQRKPPFEQNPFTYPSLSEIWNLGSVVYFETNVQSKFQKKFKFFAGERKLHLYLKGK